MAIGRGVGNVKDRSHGNPLYPRGDFCLRSEISSPLIELLRTSFTNEFLASGTKYHNHAKTRTPKLLASHCILTMNLHAMH